MTAIMGPSGCGKTTLMDILGGRADRADWSGELFYGGRPQSDRVLHSIGYVEQHMKLMPTLTVRETLVFSALLRRPYHESCAPQFSENVFPSKHGKRLAESNEHS